MDQTNQEEAPPILKSWPNVYKAVFVVFILLTLGLSLFTMVFK